MTTPCSILVAVPKPAPTVRTRKPMRRVNSRRRRRALAEDFGELATVARLQPCCVVGCERRPSDPAHVRSRGACNHAWLTDPNTGERVGNIAPLCRSHHDEQGRRGIRTFESSCKLALRWGGRAMPVTTLAEAAALLGRLVEGAS